MEHGAYEEAHSGGYEFTDEENKIIRATGRHVKIWGIFTLGSGVLVALGGIGIAVSEAGSITLFVGLLYGLLALIPIFIGLNFRQAGTALGFVVTTEGNDISHLMVAVSSLGKAFLIQVVLASIYLAVIILVLVVGGVFAVMGSG